MDSQVIHTPLLFLSGAGLSRCNGQDREFTPRMRSGFARELGATWTSTLPTGHLPMLQEPAEFARAVEDFCFAHNSG